MDELISAVETASMGSDMRIKLVNAFNEIFDKGRNVEYLSYQTSDYYAKQSDMSRLLPFDTWTRRPSPESEKLVVGATIFAATGDLHMLPTIVEEIIDNG